MTARKSQPKVVSLYSGAGGLDYGFEAAGFETVFANDFDHDSCETLRLTRHWPVVERSIFDVSTEELDVLADALRSQRGVHGARLVGAGFGGSVLALADAGTGSDAAHAAAERYRSRTGRTARVVMPV